MSAYRIHQETKFIGASVETHPMDTFKARGGHQKLIRSICFCCYHLWLEWHQVSWNKIRDMAFLESRSVGHLSPFVSLVIQSIISSSGSSRSFWICLCPQEQTTGRARWNLHYPRGPGWWSGGSLLLATNLSSPLGYSDYQKKTSTHKARPLINSQVPKTKVLRSAHLQWPDISNSRIPPLDHLWKHILSGCLMWGSLQTINALLVYERISQIIR